MLTDSLFPSPSEFDLSLFFSDDPLPMPPSKKLRFTPEPEPEPEAESSESKPPPPRRLWVKHRSRPWWDDCNRPDFPQHSFRSAFRMSRPTFDLICDHLSSSISKEDTTLRPAIPVHLRVAVCIWRLATGEPLRLVSHRFGLGISTCHKLVLQVSSAIKSLLMPKFLHFPHQFQSQNQTFNPIIPHFPNIIGSIYTTHIPIIAPKENVANYFNRRHTERNQKTSYSITLQGVVNQKGLFTDVCIGWPGSMSDEQVLEKSALFQLAENCGILKGDNWVVGGGSFPLMDWLMVPYTQRNLSWGQHVFNECIENVGRVGKEAFGRLKGRWGCLRKRTEVKLQDLPVVLGACCVLHNICEIRGEEMGVEEMGFEIFDDEMLPENAVRSVKAAKRRDELAHELLHSGKAGSSLL